MTKFKVHPVIVSATANIYKEDNTLITVTAERKTNITVPSGIRQGCTGSTTLFKLTTYLTMNKMEEESGFNSSDINISGLSFDDDGLLLSHGTDEAKHNIKLQTAISRECGLEINKSKSRVIIYNLKNQPEQTEDILQVTEETKYLGITLTNSKNIFTKQKTIDRKGTRLANLTYSVTAKSCHKLTTGKAHYCKNVCLPSILYGENI